MYFECRGGNHYKFYEIELFPGPDGLTIITASWGPIGKPRAHRVQKFIGPEAKAVKKFNQLRKQKEKKGYIKKETPKYLH